MILLATLLDPVSSQPGETASQPSSSLESPPGIKTIISGQLVDPIGRGIGTARVVVSEVGNPEIRVEVRTDMYGDFKAEFPGVRVGTFSLNADKEGYTSAKAEVEVAADDWEPFVALTLEGELTLSGEVVEALEGLPRPGASIRFKSAYRTETQLADEAGRFEFKRLLPGEAQLVVQDQGMGKLSLPVKVGGASELLTLTLHAERVLRIEVLADTGQPVSGVSVEIEVEGLNDYRSLESDTQGVVRVGEISQEARRVRARLTHADYVCTGEYDQEIALPEGQVETKATLRLEAAAVLEGTVVDSQTGLPLPGAQVMVGAQLYDRSPRDFTNQRGEFRIGSLTAGELVVTVYPAGFAPDLQRVHTVARKNTEVHFKVHPGRLVSGLVKDVVGQPVKGVDVEAIRWRGQATLGLYARTDEQGIFRLENAPVDEFMIDMYTRSSGDLFDQLISANRNEYEFQLAGEGGDSDRRSMELAKVKPGDSLPAIQLVSLDHGKFGSEQFWGKWVLLDFWATWCGPCREEMPNQKRIHQAFGRRDDFLMFGISRDYERRALRDFIKTQGVDWPQVFGSASGSDELARNFGVRAIPCTVLIGKDGKIVAVGLTGDELFQKLSDLLGSEGAQEKGR